MERSVRFNVEDEVIVDVLLLEGENMPEIDDERPTVNEADKCDVDNNAPDAEIQNPIPEFEGRGKCIRRETEKVRMLREGSGRTGGRTGETLPRGMQSGTPVTPVNAQRAEYATSISLDSTIDHAMATVIEGMEGSMPTFEEAKKRPDWPKWQEAIRKELDSLEKMGTWRMVKRPPDTNVVDTKWVLKIKKNSAGEIDKYKARLIARGFTQIYGIDYYETYAPVARLTSFGLMLALAARKGWAVDNFNFNQAYLNSKLDDDEVVYVEQPPGYKTKNRREWVMRLL